MSSHIEEAGYAKKRPISTHKAFAPIVALWFAALLGLGSLVLPVAQIEQLVLLTGIANYLPMIAPPLDITGRAIVAVVLALLGGAIGQAIASRLGKAHAQYAAEDAGDETRTPISAHDELGDLEAEEEAPRRGRRLAIEDDTQEEQVIEFAPLPMATLVDEEENEADSEITFELETVENDDPEPDEEAEIVVTEEEEPVIEASNVPEPILEAVDPTPEPEPEPEPTTEPEIEEAPLALDPDVQVAATAVQQEQVAPLASPCQGRPLEELGLVQLVERLGASMQKHRSMGARLAASPANIPVPQPYTEQGATFVQSEEVIAAGAEEAAEVEDFAVEAPVAALEPIPAEDIVEVGRTGPAEPLTALEAEFEPAATEVSVEAEKALHADDVPADEPGLESGPEAPVAEEVVEAAPEETIEQAEPEQAPPVEEVAVEDESQAIAEEDAAQEPEPQAELVNPFAQFASFGEDEDEDEEELASLEDSFRLPIGNNAAMPDEDEDDREDEGEEDGEGDEEVYGSLLSLRRPFSFEPFGESEGENEAEVAEAVAEPTTGTLSQPSPEQAEEREQLAAPPAASGRDLDTEAHQRALRDALLSLQKLDRAG